MSQTTPTYRLITAPNRALCTAEKEVVSCGESSSWK